MTAHKSKAISNRTITAQFASALEIPVALAKEVLKEADEELKEPIEWRDYRRMLLTEDVFFNYLMECAEDDMEENAEDYCEWVTVNWGALVALMAGEEPPAEEPEEEPEADAAPVTIEAEVVDVTPKAKK